jgi:hypothetical protein
MSYRFHKAEESFEEAMILRGRADFYVRESNNSSVTMQQISFSMRNTETNAPAKTIEIIVLIFFNVISLRFFFYRSKIN